MYNQFPTSAGQPVQSQYRMATRQPFQPTGFVQSFYGSNQQSMMNPQAQSYQTANYVGNQPGHDQNLRVDSTRPSNIQAGYMGGQGQFGMGASQGISSFRSSVIPTQSFATTTQFGGGLGQQANQIGQVQGTGLMNQGFRRV